MKAVHSDRVSAPTPHVTPRGLARARLLFKKKKTVKVHSFFSADEALVPNPPLHDRSGRNSFQWNLNGTNDK